MLCRIIHGRATNINLGFPDMKGSIYHRSQLNIIRFFEWNFTFVKLEQFYFLGSL